MAAMQIAADPIQEFKDEFRKRLDRFMQKRAAEIGEPGKWKTDHIVISNNIESPTIKFKRPQKSSLYFVLPRSPEGLSDDERLELRRYISLECAKKGFREYKPRSHLSSKTIEKIREGDHEAWNKFAQKHFPKAQQYAAHALRGKSSIQDADDLANMALFKLFEKCRDDKLRDRPTSLLGRLITEQTADTKRKQSDEVATKKVLQEANEKYNRSGGAVANHFGKCTRNDEPPAKAGVRCYYPTSPH